MIKVVQVQSSSTSAGGAALKLHDALLDADIDSTVLTLHPDVNDTDKIHPAGKFPELLYKLDDKLHLFITRNCIKEFGLFSYPLIGTDISKIKLIREADIIYIHWVQGGFLTLAGYRKLAKLGKPVIIFMHDMWTITGGCHYSFLCEKYKSHCYDCQVFPKHKDRDLSYIEFNKKLKLYSGFENFYFVSPSRWLYKCAEESFLLKSRPLFHIPNITDIQIFKPFDKKVAKSIFQINEENYTIAFGAVSVDSPYKGWEYLKKALDILKNISFSKKISILIFGKGFNSQIAREIPFETKFTGFLRDKYSLAMVYNAADVFVTPSLADNLPTTVLESQACGVAVVGFDTGGIPEMINHKKNGYIAKYRDAEDLATGIKYCLENKVRGQLLPEFDKKLIVAKHISLINSLKQAGNY